MFQPDFEREALENRSMDTHVHIIITVRVGTLLHLVGLAEIPIYNN